MPTLEDKIYLIDNMKALKLEDAKLLYQYLSKANGESIDSRKICNYYGGDPLRCHTLIIEFELAGIIEVTQRGCFGEVLECRLSQYSIP